MGRILPPEDVHRKGLSCSAMAAFPEGGIFTHVRTQTVPATLLRLSMPLLWITRLRLRVRMSASSKEFCIRESTKSRFLIYLGVPPTAKALALTPLWHARAAVSQSGVCPRDPWEGPHLWAGPRGLLFFLHNSLTWGSYLIVFCIIPPTLCKNIVQVVC